MTVLSVASASAFQNQDASRAITNRYSGIANTFVRVYREQGLLSFWRGNMTSVLRYFPSQALTFALNDQLARSLRIGKDVLEVCLDRVFVKVGGGGVGL